MIYFSLNIFSCSINKKIEVEVRSHQPFSSYTYLIVCHEQILESKTIKTLMSDSVSSEPIEYMHSFSFVPTLDYATILFIIIYCMREGALVTTTVVVKMLNDYKNFIELDIIPRTVQPGQIVDITVKSNPNSYVGLLGIDETARMFGRSGRFDCNHLNNYRVWEELNMLNAMEMPSSHRNTDPRKILYYYSDIDDFSVSIN